MDDLLWLIPALPLTGFLLLVFLGTRFSRRMVAVIGTGAVCLSAMVTFGIAFSFLFSAPSSGHYAQTLWVWMEVAGFSPKISLYLDPLSLVFVFVITFVGSLIHLYSVEFMAADKDYSRFFASMNLFVTSMLILVLADDLLLLYLGWEGVGLCSYLLIGFWYENPLNGYAARKAFIITRIGDTAMAVALFILFRHFNTLSIPEITQQAPQQWALGSSVATITAILLLAGGAGKSAQLPFQTWLPDAMAGPSPVSALIHAATMVTAGVYLIARMHVVFELSPVALTIVAVVGAATLIIAGCSALTQSDIKKVLAYSTISQIGYMFLALGVGAWTAAIFHFMIHAFFKALLFLAAGAIIEALHHEHNMFKMGGLKDRLPVIFWTFLIGSAALAALPLLTAGFYSKDQILWYAWSSTRGNFLLWFTGLAGAFITALYTTRMMSITFWGEMKTPVSHSPGRLMTVPLLVLAVLSVSAGFIELPHNVAHFALFSTFLHSVLPETLVQNKATPEWVFQVMASAATIAGIYLSFYLYLKKPQGLNRLKQSHILSAIYRFFFSGWQFDSLYNKLIVNPFVQSCKINKSDFIDRLYSGIARVSSLAHSRLSSTQNGSLRWYAVGLLIGSILIITLQIVI